MKPVSGLGLVSDYGYYPGWVTCLTVTIIRVSTHFYVCFFVRQPISCDIIIIAMT